MRVVIISLRIFVIAILVGIIYSFDKKEEWMPLLDKELSAWEMYLSFKHQTNYNGQTLKDEDGKELMPIGYNKNVNQVFSIIEQEGALVLRISGEIYGCVFTKKEFENYHLKLKVKWGTKKWVPRLNEPMDSGILYHSHGECGVDYWKSWMQAHEFQIIEGGFGDYWCIAATGGLIKMDNPNARNDMGIYDPEGIDTPMGAGGLRSGFVRHSKDYEKSGEWNTVELICFEDKSLHIVNGHVVMALSKSVYLEDSIFHPLVKGKIQLQSEAAEVYYKDIQIRNIESLPDNYKDLFGDGQ